MGIKPLEVTVATFVLFIRKLSSMKTAIWLLVCCFLLNFRFESGNAAKTQLAKLKSVRFRKEANEHVGHNGRCKYWGGNCTYVPCCAHLVCQLIRGSLSFCAWMENLVACFIAMSNSERTI